MPLEGEAADSAHSLRCTARVECIKSPFCVVLPLGSLRDGAKQAKILLFVMGVKYVFFGF